MMKSENNYYLKNSESIISIYYFSKLCRYRTFQHTVFNNIIRQDRQIKLLRNFVLL